MIHGQIGSRPAILAPVAVPSQNVLSGEYDLFERDLYKKYKPYNTWIIKTPAYGGYSLFGNTANGFSFSEIDQYNGPSDIAYRQRFIVLV